MTLATLRLAAIRLLLALLLPLVSGAAAQPGKPEALPPAGAAPQAGGKPPPLAPGGAGETPARRVPQSQGGREQAPARCAQPLANNCLTQQSSCQIACPPMWSTNPGAPAFTPTNRTSCMQQCRQRYLACMRLYNCM
jgi:hypothetical protein